jgi:AraC-like DNA-binding protein
VAGASQHTELSVTHFFIPLFLVYVPKSYLELTCYVLSLQVKSLSFCARRNVMQLLSPAITVSALLAGLECLGFDANELLRPTGISPAQLAEPFAAVPDQVFGQIWRQAFARDPRPDLPLRAGLAVPYGAFGLLNHIVENSETVGAAYHSLRLFLWLVATGMSLEFEHNAGDWVWVINEEGVSPARYVSDQWIVGICIRRTRDVVLSPPVSKVYLSQPDTVPTQVFEQSLGVPVRLGQDRSGFKLVPGIWTTKIKGANPVLHQTLRTIAESVEIKQFQESPLSFIIRTRLPDALDKQQYSAAAVAKQLGFSSRTLQRRLAEEQLTFKQVLEAYRQDEAVRLMLSGDKSLVQVAHALGYNEQSSFTRAFKRWTGKTPSVWLKAAGRSTPACT